MGVSYHVYSNDGQGGPIDYSTVIATVAAASASPFGSFGAGPLARPSDNLFAVRAFDDVSGVEEANTDARVHVVIDPSGQDISSQPNPVVGLAVRWTVGDVALVSWGYSSAAQGGPPTQFDITAVALPPVTPGLVSPPTQSVTYTGVAGYGCRLEGLASMQTWLITVRTVGASDLIVSPPTSANLPKQAGVLAPVDGLIATASA